MLRFSKLWLAAGLLAALWGMSRIDAPQAPGWLRPIGTRPGPVRILQFYASVGAVTAGQTARLCYGVENARKVRISPTIPGVYPSVNHCLDVVPEHTTHYVLLAEGYDGRVTTKSFTLPVQTAPISPQILNYATAVPRGAALPQRSL